ncbi:MAG: hypothetical protein M3063_10010, partial [Actinomycetota bacterium]|nr:hypothetical protein [Actinomycetota bacterium]
CSRTDRRAGRGPGGLGFDYHIPAVPAARATVHGHAVLVVGTLDRQQVRDLPAVDADDRGWRRGHHAQ